MKKILIVMHNYAEISDLIKKNLDFLGYQDIDFIFYAGEKFKYKSWSQKITSFYRKTFLGDKTYKEQLRAAFTEETLLHKAQNLSGYDVIIVMNTDFFSDEFLATLKTKTKKMVGNHWDGLSRTPHIDNKISFFDRFYVFDKKDADESRNIFFLTNFFFDFKENFEHENVKQDIYYLATFVKERFGILKKISEVLASKAITQKILLFSWNPREPEGSVKFTNTFLSYEENIKNVKESRALLDLKLPEHNGLSFRFFEALKYEKKMITDNCHIKDYDFYHPKNIFIINEDSEDGLKDFIDSPYKKISTDIKNKYSFGNWFKTLIS